TDVPGERSGGGSAARAHFYAGGSPLSEFLPPRPPSQAHTRAALTRKTPQRAPPRPRQYHPAVPRDLETIVLKAIAREPARRYPSARALHDDLGRFLEDRPIRARRMGVLERLGRWCRRNPAGASLAALAVGLVLLVAAVATAGYVHTRDALAGETRQRQRAEAATLEESRQRERAEKVSLEEAQQRHRAEATAGLSLEVLEQIFERLAPD